MGRAGHVGKKKMYSEKTPPLCHKKVAIDSPPPVNENITDAKNRSTHAGRPLPAKKDSRGGNKRTSLTLQTPSLAASCLESLVAPQANSLHDQPFVGSSIADIYGARRWYAFSVAWHLTHAAWNLLRRIETGNTPRAPLDARALRYGNRIAIWWEEPPASGATSGWYTAKVFDPIVERSTQHIFKYDSDNSVFTHELMPRALQNAVGNAARWAPAPPALAPACPHPRPSDTRPSDHGVHPRPPTPGF